ncbi:MAG: hypothetical protein AAF456_08495 [Planctomycetota bacterium]
MSGKTALAYFAVAAVVIALVVWSSNQGYGKVSQSAYEVATATYSASLARSLERIESVEELLEEDSRLAAMSEQEVRWLRDILDSAKAGHWEEAADAARMMMEDQVEHQ